MYHVCDWNKYSNKITVECRMFNLHKYVVDGTTQFPPFLRKSPLFYMGPGGKSPPLQY